MALPAGIVATVSVRGETYDFPEAGVSTCTVGSSVLTVIASTADPRLTLTITWRATGGSRHVSFGNPGRPGVWQAGDSIPGASELVLEVEGRSAELSGPMRHTDESIDQVTIRVAC